MNHRNTTPLRVGMRATFDGRTYELVGRLVMGMVEEGETYYWDEFLLVSPDGHDLFVEYDEGQWRRMEVFLPRNPMTPQQAAQVRLGSHVNLDGHTATVTQVSRMTVHHLEGRLTWPANVGETRPYFDADYLGVKYAVEWSQASGEIEFYRGRALSKREVYTAFDLKRELEVMDAAERRSTSQLRFAMLCFAMAVFGFIGWFAAKSSGEVISRGQVVMAGTGESQFRFGPVRLEPQKNVHRLTVYGQMAGYPGSVRAGLEPASGAGAATRPTGPPYSRDPWGTYTLRDGQEFTVARPADYVVRLTGQGGSVSPAVGYELRGGAWYPGYFLGYGVAALILGVIFLIMGGVSRGEAAG